jgi:ATP synthase protein I
MADDLKARIEAAKVKLQEPNGRAEQNRAWQFLSEIVAGLIVGGGIGWFLDGWFGSKPWLFIVFLLLGVAGAFWNMMRLASRDEIVHIKRD